MPAVAKKSTKKAAPAKSPVVNEKKFVSQSLENKKANKKSKKPVKTKQRRRGIVYIKHLPHGFYEEELRGYFSQFGAVTRVRLARSTRTLGSKGYAFIEFRYPEVAEIAAEAMNNYLMFKNIIKTRYIPPNEIKHDFFRSGVKKVKKDGVKVLTSKTIEAREKIVENTNRLMTTEDEVKRKSKVEKKMISAAKRLEDLGIEYDVDVINQSLKEQAKKKKVDSDVEEPMNVSNIDIDTEDEFEDINYQDEDAESDEEQLVEAVTRAKAARTKQDDEQNKKTAAQAKPGKGKENVAKKAKPEPVKKGKKNAAPAPKAAEKPAPAAKQAKVAEKPAPAAKPAAAEKSKKAAKNQKKAKAAAEPETPVAVAAEPAPKKSRQNNKKAAKEQPKTPEVKSPVVVAEPKQQKPNKKAAAAAKKGKAEKVVKPVEVAAPPPAEEPKVKKLAKASKTIDKKKSPKVEQKLKVAAKSVVEEVVKEVKTKEIKAGKKKPAKK